MDGSLTLPFPNAVELVRQYGGPVSHAALDPAHKLFRTPGIEGLVGYWLAPGCAIVQGDPICAPEHKTALADAFAAYCKSHNQVIVYVGATAAMQAYAHGLGYASIEFANLLMADPQQDPEAGRHLRQHLNHTRRTGVTVREYWGETSPDDALEARVEAACERWLGSRHGPQMFLGRQRLFEDKLGRRWFIAEQQGEVVGVLSLLRMGAMECYSLINIVFSTPTAPPHTNELLVVEALRALREEKAHQVCLGIGPQATLGLVEGGHRVSRWLWRNLYKWAARLMHLQGKTLFWEKFPVTQREPLYLLFQSPQLGLRELNALFRAFHFSVK